MKSTFISKEKNEVKFTMEFTAEEFEKAVNDAYQATKGKYVVDGFRKGKAPRKLIEARYGEDVFFEDAINQMFSKGYPAALDELAINPVDRPSADFDKIEKGEGFKVTITVTVKPEFEVKDYKGVKVTKVEHAITDEDVNKELESLQKRNSRLVAVERPAQDGDTVLIDYAGFVGEEQFEGGTAERQPLTLGSGTFIPGFEEQLVGAVVGEERDVKVTFPTEYHSTDLAGKEAIFKCKVHEIKETEKPELNDEFAKDVSEFDTLEELKKDSREKLEKTAASKAEYETKNAVLEKVYEANEIDIPEIMVEDQIDEMMQEFDQQLRYQGLDLQKYFEYLQKDPKEFRGELRADAHKKVKTRLVVEAVANAEKLEVSQEEIDAELKAMADQYKMEVEKLKEAMQAENMMYLEKDIKMRKAVDFMFENAIVE
ncbi:trigger factor [Sinanaerobacter chloroacetimidivorans]|jgi:trigger factor|uniref:Trigger factor n=1 Tax=Sinanaerobacter chloroacetimidivorans TaxID=2818044 RepID=A0A8J8B0U0_9FIRM|nr:trigger factor [Sinanaerobacter chloroacetimidivorans]MBR0597127.1 trigger factor [Sinanaerobacter chloroacetimidivorans]